jgi:hypothetical protein
MNVPQSVPVARATWNHEEHENGTFPDRCEFEARRHTKETSMLSTILLVLLILILIGALPSWRHSRNWGYGTGGLVGVLLIIVIVLALTGRI